MDDEEESSQNSIGVSHHFRTRIPSALRRKVNCPGLPLTVPLQMQPDVRELALVRVVPRPVERLEAFGHAGPPPRVVVDQPLPSFRRLFLARLEVSEGAVQHVGAVRDGALAPDPVGRGREAVRVVEAADAPDGHGDGLLLVQRQPQLLPERGPVGRQPEAGGDDVAVGVGRHADDGLRAAEMPAVVEAGDVGCGWEGFRMREPLLLEWFEMGRQRGRDGGVGDLQSISSSIRRKIVAARSVSSMTSVSSLRAGISASRHLW